MHSEETSKYRSSEGVSAQALDAGRVALGVDAVRCTYGGVIAVDGVSFQATRGECVAIIGPNGAGKSTLLDNISGLNLDYTGTVTLLGHDVSGWPLHKRAALGVARSFQVPRMFGRMSVLSNLMVAAQKQAGENPLRAVLGGWQAGDRARLTRAHQLAAQFGLEPVLDSYAAELSGGQERLLELARALMSDPQVLLLDEPFAGVSPANRSRLVRHIRELSVKGGVTVLMVEHRLEWVKQLCERIVVMATGKVIAEGSLAEVVRHRDVIDAYLGRRAV